MEGMHGALALGILFSLSDVESAFTAYDVFLFLDNIALPLLVTRFMSLQYSGMRGYVLYMVHIGNLQPESLADWLLLKHPQPAFTRFNLVKLTTSKQDKFPQMFATRTLSFGRTLPTIKPHRLEEDSLQ
eukprot:1145163-Pelagomonas_calceolata.AAC.4